MLVQVEQMGTSKKQVPVKLPEKDDSICSIQNNVCKMYMFVKAAITTLDLNLLQT